MAEAFVNTVKRNYIHGADLSDGETVIRQLLGWIDDYNRIAPHSSTLRLHVSRNLGGRAATAPGNSHCAPT
jgi:putative transposase